LKIQSSRALSLLTRGKRTSSQEGFLEETLAVPSLTEYAIRSLLTPDYSNGKNPRIESFLPLSDIDGLPLPMHVKNIIRASTGHGKERLKEQKEPFDAEEDVTANICPGHGGVRSYVFCDHIEERTEWVGTVGGVQIAESRSGWVPSTLFYFQSCNNADDMLLSSLAGM